jgi:cytoskeletal protein CcmA (bactofilin family)
MKKSLIYLVSLLILALSATMYFARRAELQASSANSAPESQTTPSAVPTHEDFMTAGETVKVSSEGSTGDVIVAGANVQIAGEVHGYVMAAGANVSVNGPVGNDLLAAGANVDVNAPVGDNAMLAGSAVNISKDASIGGSARIAASTINVFGRVTRDLHAAGANVNIASEIGGNADIRGERVVIDPGAVIRGTLTVYSPGEPTISPDAQVVGGVVYHKSESSRSPSLGSWLVGWLLRFVWLTLLGLVAVWFSSVWVGRVAETIRSNTGRSVLTGLIALIAAPILCVLLLVTVIGLPLGVVLGAMTIVALMLSAMFVSYFIGGWITSQIKQWQDSNVAKILLGSLVISFVIMLPWIGGLAKLLIVIFGLGAFLIERRDLFKTMRAQGLA